jgi:hypothetical protein
MKVIMTISSMSDIASLSVEVMNKQDFWFNCKVGLMIWENQQATKE